MGGRIMKVEKVLNGIRYTLSNQNLQVGDKVYPIARGRCLDNGGWILHEIEFESKYVEGLNTSGFPDEPHTILDLKHSKDYKPYEVRTDMGYSPIECYFKIIKKEKQEKIDKSTKNFIQLKNMENTFEPRKSISERYSLENMAKQRDMSVESQRD